VCGRQYPVGSDTRLQAGEPLGETVLKCALRPLDVNAYPVRFTASEQKTLRETFRTGVCDYGRPGVGQDQRPAVWRDYGVG
jgi:hypothetical protein